MRRSEVRKSKSPAKPTLESATPRRGWKLWSFRLAALILLPLLGLGLLELVLRLAGYGYPTAFLLPRQLEGKPLLVQNNQFGWRFFGPQMARTPCPIALPATKRPGTVRIFVFGESAAYGDPQARFGLPRMLEALLSLRHPGTRFEVVNAAMTAINSHTLLPIARDCAHAQGDLWVLYMGNNEVVGPFGAGTVFGAAAAPLPVIRASLAFRATRLGQLADGLVRALHKPPADQAEWGGMMMFLGHQVAWDEPRLQTVYHHFEQNVHDILAAGRRAGVGIVVSTVAVDLKDCAPFGSAHRKGLTEADKGRWDQIYQQGIAAEEAGQYQQAAERFATASQVDDAVAELRFREGQCSLALGQVPEAQRQFQAARDLDTLRFRCDSKLNGILRQAAAAGEQDRILLADAERVFAEQSPNGLPGADLFYEHVHLTFDGNYLLGLTIARQLEKLLPGELTRQVPSAQPWPGLADCARRLAWNDWNRQAALTEIFSRLGDPPFTAQLNHNAQMQRLAQQLQQLAPAVQPAGRAVAIKNCLDALALAPDDPWLHSQLASLRQAAGDLAGAESSARRGAELLPSNAEAWDQLGYIEAQRQEYAAAIGEFHRAAALDPQDLSSRQNLAQALEKLGKRNEAEQAYREVLALKRRFGMAWLGLGQMLEQEGRKTEAEECFQRGLTNRIHHAPELVTLARFCASRGWFEAASTNFLDALKLNPADPMLHLETGQSLAAAGQHAQAEEQYAEAIRLAPDLPQARFLHGLELGRKGDAGGAAEDFGEAVRLMPQLLEARLNLGIALVKLNHAEEALAQFEQVLEQSPTNALALRYVQALRSAAAARTNSPTR